MLKVLQEHLKLFVKESASFVLYESYLVIYVKECEEGEDEVAGEKAKLGG